MFTHCILLICGISLLNGLSIVSSDPPEPWDTATMARYIMHLSDWVSVATISTIKTTITYPFVNLKSVSDGPLSKGTGVPYILLTDMDLTGKDVLKDNRCTILASLAQSDYCKKSNLDPQDPRCARVILTGHVLKVDEKTPEYKFANESLVERHPQMANWPSDHDFYIAKVNIEQVIVLDYFGGVKYVSVKDYFNANIKKMLKYWKIL